MTARPLLAALAGLALACSGPCEPAPVDPAPASTSATATVGAAAHSLEVAPELVADTAAALDLWARATDGTATFDVWSVTFGAIPECTGPHAACYRYATHQIDVSPAVAPQSRASSIAHEFGHTLGLPDEPGSGTLMDPERTDRGAQCIDRQIVNEAGLSGPGACL